jgi:hypothetical protein
MALIPSRKLVFVAGSCFVLNAENAHPRIIISDPTLNPESIVIVNATSWDDEKDQCCVLERHDCVALTKKSCINYRQAFVASLKELEYARNHAALTMSGVTVPDETMQKILSGASATQFLPRGCKKILRDQQRIA